MQIKQLETVPFHTLAFRTSGSGGLVREAELPFLRAVARGPAQTGPLIFCSDLQGRIDGVLLGVALAEEIQLLVELEEMKPPSGIVLVGDLYDHPELQKLGASGDVREVLVALAKLAPVIAVLGNHDRLNEIPDGCEILDGTTGHLNGITFGGVSGIIGRPSRPMRKTASEFQVAMKRVMTKRTDLLLLHQGPPGTNAHQRGSTEVLEALATHRELLLVCGHCHWKDPICTLDSVQVLNVDCRVIVMELEQ